MNPVTITLDTAAMAQALADAMAKHSIDLGVAAYTQIVQQQLAAGLPSGTISIEIKVTAA